MWVFLSSYSHRFSCSTTCGILSSLTRDRTCASCIERQILNHWTTREVPQLDLKDLSFLSLKVSSSHASASVDEVPIPWAYKSPIGPISHHIH